MADFADRHERTAVFGAPYSWTSKGIRNVISRFKNEYDGPDEPPAITYDGRHHLFSMKTDDKIAVNQFSKILRGVILFSTRDNIDYTDDPLMLDIPGTVHATDNSIPEDHGIPTHTLIDIVEDSDDSSDDSSLSGIGLAYWKPANNDISILTSDVAASILTITDCYFHPEQDSSRVKIVGGSVQVAVQKLRNMEPLLEHLHRHRDGAGSTVTQNLVSFTSQTPGKGVEYVKVDRLPHYERIIVPKILQENLHRMLIGEERVYSADNCRWETPSNLLPVPEPLPILAEDGVVEHRRTARSKIWAGVEISTIGSPDNAQPKVTAIQTTLNGTINGLRGPLVEHSRFLDPIDENRLRHWTRTVDTAADPAVAATEPVEADLPEDEVKEWPTRRVAEDSDSEDEVDIRRIKAQDSAAHSSDSEDDIPLHSTMQNQKVFHQDPDEIRKSRASRTKKPEGSVPFVQDKMSMNRDAFAQANSFYANLPREPEGPDASLIPLNKKEAHPPAIVNIATREPRRRFGYDGTDEYESPPAQTPEISGHFDPSAYGLRNRHNKAPSTDSRTLPGQGRSRTSHSYVDHELPALVNPVPTWPRPVTSQNTLRSGQISSRVENSERKPDELIQYESDQSDRRKSLKPPPGLIARELPRTKDEHLLDAPLEQIQRPSLRPMTDEPVYSSEEASFSTSSSSAAARLFRSQYTPQTKVSRPDFSQLRGGVLQNLMNARKAAQAAHTSFSNPNIERIAEEDEISTRKFHNTMNLKAPNKGKRGSRGGAPSKNSQISKAQQALRDDFQPVRPQGASIGSHMATRSGEEGLTERALQSAESNANMAALHGPALQSAAMTEMSKQFKANLTPALEAARTFSGHVQLEMQIGQLMISPSTKIKDKIVYEIQKWTDTFASDRIVAKFSNILTNHGHDIDGMLETKTKRQKTWNPDYPGPSEVLLEFTCHDNTGQYFKLHIKDDGSSVIKADPVIITKIGIHCPGRTWDLCAVLSGSAQWQNAKAELAADINQFVDTLHMQAGLQAVVYFRPPAGDSFAIDSVVYKRKSLHNCQVAGSENLQMQVSETKILTVKSHKDDKKLLVAVESRAPNLDPGQPDLYYQVCVVDKDLNKLFDTNKAIVTGDRTPEAVSVSLECAQDLLSTSLRLVDKIDWVGRRNYGTLVQLADIATARAQRLDTIAPLHSRLAPSMLPISGGNHAGQSFAVRSTIVPSTVSTRRPQFTNSDQSLPGVRAGTSAQMFHDANGNRFYYGPGGARVPVHDSMTLNGMTNSEIHPTDSASQYGGTRRNVKSTSHDDKPPNFW